MPWSWDPMVDWLSAGLVLRPSDGRVALAIWQINRQVWGGDGRIGR